MVSLGVTLEQVAWVGPLNTGMDIKQTLKPKRTKQQAALETQQNLSAGAVALQAEVTGIAKRGVGQPSKFTREKWEEVLEHIACYGDLIDICSRPDMPAVSTVRRWYREDPALKAEFREAWEEASLLGHSVNTNILRGGILSTGDFRRDEALAANNRWFMSKTNRRDFGDKVQVEVTAVQVFVMPNDAIDGEGY